MGYRLNSAKRRLAWLVSFTAVVVGVAFQIRAGIPPAEELLPQDTLFMVTAPDFGKLREIFQASPQNQLWNSPAMRPFKEKFLARWSEEFIKPLEHELDLRFDDYISLPQGQLTFAVTQNGAAEQEDQPMDKLLLLDTRDKSDQLKTNLFELRKKWVDAGKLIKSEKILGFEFFFLHVTSNDITRTLQKFFPRAPQVQELGDDDNKKTPPQRNELVIGQVDSLLIIGNSLKAVEKIATHLTGGSMPSLKDLAAYDADHQALFRDAPFYGWVNMKAFVEQITRQAAAKKEPDAPDPFGNVNPAKILAAMGLAGVKTIAFNLEAANEGTLFQVFIGVPESSRQGIFKLLGGEGKEFGPPAFVPADAVKFQRWRIDGQKAWVTLEKMLGDISPQWVAGLNQLLDAANAVAKEKDPGFDVKRNFIGNLGDDLLSYEKASRGASPASLLSPPSLFLVGSPRPEELAAALKRILGFLNQQGGPTTEREFLGRKIFSLPAPALPMPIPTGSKPAAPQTLNCAASGGYVAISTDAAMLEEFLRSSSSEGKTLRETAGLTEAAQRVIGPGVMWFGYQNQLDRMRTTFDLLKKDPRSVTNSTMSLLPALFGIPNPEPAVRGLMDFSLLPPIDRLAKYFHFSVYGGSANVQGLTLKFFSPSPPKLSDGLVD